jgi:hypothetical protein
VGVEIGTLRRQGDQPGVPGRCTTPRIRLRGTSRLGLLTTCVALAGALAAPAAGVPKPDPAPDPAPTTKQAAEQPAPDAFPSSGGSDRSASSTSAQPDPTPSQSSPPAAAPQPITPAPVAASPPTSTARQSQPAAEKPKRRTTTRRVRDVEVISAPPSRVRSLGPQVSAPTVATAVVDPAEMRGLVLGGLALLMLALASGSLLFLVTRGGVREARP